MDPFTVAYGEDHPRLIDDRLPMMLVLLDGLGDRPQPSLGGRTPAEAAHTPTLDALAARGENGAHVPLGPGRAPASEVAHWRLFGMGEHPFPGRAVFEALGHGVEVAHGALLLYAALRPSERRDGAIWITGRVRRDEPEAGAALLDGCRSFAHGAFRFDLHVLSRGEGILVIEGPVGAVTDTDPFLEHLHPWMAPQALADDASGNGVATAAALGAYLQHTRRRLRAHPLNAERRRQGLPVLDAITTKWASVSSPDISFEQHVGVRGAMVATSPFYRGLGRLLGMDVVEAHGTITDSLATARACVEAGAAFVHVHTKATDEAGHTKRPGRKVEVIERLDAELAPLLDAPFDEWVVAVTGDHATPSSHGVLHTGDPTPFTVTAPWLRPDRVERFGEQWCATGAVGRLGADDVLPLLLSHANRARFLGSRPSPFATLATPDRVVAFTPDDGPDEAAED